MTTVAKLVFWEILGVCRQNPALTGPEGCLAAGPARVCRKEHLTAPPSRTLSRSFKPVVFPQTGCSGSSWGGVGAAPPHPFRKACLSQDLQDSPLVPLFFQLYCRSSLSPVLARPFDDYPLVARGKITKRPHQSQPWLMGVPCKVTIR